LSDAGANDFTIDAYARMAQKKLASTMLCTVEEPKRNKTIDLELTKNPITGRERMLGLGLDAYHSNSPAFMFYEGLDSAQANMADLESQGAKCLPVFGDSVLSDPEKEQKHRFIADVNNEVAAIKPNFVMANSAALAGLSINDEEQQQIVDALNDVSVLPDPVVCQI